MIKSDQKFICNECQPAIRQDAFTECSVCSRVGWCERQEKEKQGEMEL